MKALGNQDALAEKMSNMASDLRAAITKHGIIQTAAFGPVYAFEVDGYMGQTFSKHFSIARSWSRQLPSLFPRTLEALLTLLAL